MNTYHSQITGYINSLSTLNLKIKIRINLIEFGKLISPLIQFFENILDITFGFIKNSYQLKFKNGKCFNNSLFNSIKFCRLDEQSTVTILSPLKAKSNNSQI